MNKAEMKKELIRLQDENAGLKTVLTAVANKINLWSNMMAKSNETLEELTVTLKEIPNKVCDITTRV